MLVAVAKSDILKHSVVLRQCRPPHTPSHLVLTTVAEGRSPIAKCTRQVRPSLILGVAFAISIAADIQHIFNDSQNVLPLRQCADASGKRHGDYDSRFWQP